MKHERSEPVSRWRDYAGSPGLSRWGSAKFRKPTGHGKQGGWHIFPEQSRHGYGPFRSAHEILKDENCRPSVSCGNLKYVRNYRKIRGSSNRRDWEGNSRDSSNGFQNTNGRPHNLNHDKRLIDDTPTCPSHPHSELLGTCDQLQLKEQHDKMYGVNGFAIDQRCEGENSMGSIDWKPLKWTRFGSSSSRGYGFSHSSSSKSVCGVDSIEVKAESQPKNATPIQSPSGAAACMMDTLLCEEMNSTKRLRLGWGEGLAKYEKKKEGTGEDVNKTTIVFSSNHTEPVQSNTSNSDKSPKVTRSPDCESPETPSSIACCSSTGLDDKLYEVEDVDHDIRNLCLARGPEYQSHLDWFSFNLEKVDINSIANFGTSLIDVLHTEVLSSLDSNFLRSTTNKLRVLKVDILKAVEKAESEIGSLEIELKTLKSESLGSLNCPATSCSLPARESEPCQDQCALSDFSLPHVPLQTFEMHANVKDADFDSPGIATSKFDKPLPLLTWMEGIHGNFSEDFDGSQSPCKKLGTSVHNSNGEKTSISICGGDENACMPVCSDTKLLHCGGDDKLSEFILSSNKKYASDSMEVFSKCLPREMCEVGNSAVFGVSNLQDNFLVRQRFARKKQLLKFKERVITIKFKAFQHIWKKDLQLLSVRRNRAKSQKKFDLGLCTISGGFQKHRSSIRSRVCSAGTLGIVPTTDINNKFTSKLLLDSQVKLYRNILKMPALVLHKEKRFISSNGLVEDPYAVEKELMRINPWTNVEREIFMDNLVVFGKDFSKISSFLSHKTTADCVEFYYKNHKSDSFEKTKKKLNLRKQGTPSTSTYMVTSGKRWNPEMNAASLDMLGAASMMVARADSREINRHRYSRGFVWEDKNDAETTQGDDGFLERSGSYDISGNERETVATDFLAGICSSFSSEATSSCVTSSVDPGESNQEWKFQKVDWLTKRPLTPEVTQNVEDETCSDQSCGEIEQDYWTDEEKSIFIQAVSSYGKDFAKISQCMRTRSMNQCKVFFSKARKYLGLDLIHQECDGNQLPKSADDNGGGGDADDACVIETGPAICRDDPGSKLEQDSPVFVTKIKLDEYSSAEIINIQDDSTPKKSNAAKLLRHKEVRPVEALVADSCQTGETPTLDCDADSSVVIIKEFCDPEPAPKTVAIDTNTASRGSEVVDQASQFKLLNHKDARPVEALVADSCQTGETHALDCDADSSDMIIEEFCDPEPAPKTVAIDTIMARRKSEVIDQASQSKLLTHKDVRPVEALVADSCQTGETPALDCDADSSLMIIEEFCDPEPAPKIVARDTNMASRGSEVVDQAIFQEKVEMEVGRSSYALVERKDVVVVSSREFDNEVEKSDILNDNRTLHFNSDDQVIHMHCPVGNSHSVRDASANLETGTDSGSGFSVKPEYHHQASGHLNSGENFHAISLKRESSLSGNSVSQCPVTVKCEETLEKDCLSLARDFRESRVDRCCKNVGKKDVHHSSMAGYLSNNIKSAHILGGYPWEMPTQKEMNVNVTCGMLSGVQGLPKFERNLNGDYHLQKCNSSKSLCTVAEHPLLSKNLKRERDGAKTNTRSLPDTDKPRGNGDVKLFGKILHPSSLARRKCNRRNDDNGTYLQKLSSRKMSHPNVINGQNSVVQKSPLRKFDHSNYLGVENVPLSSYGFWDGNRVQTGLLTFPDSAFLLSKYPAAFCNYPMSTLMMGQQPLQAVYPRREYKMNGVSVCPTRKISNGRELMDYQVYNGRGGTGVQAYTVDMNQRQSIFDFHRRNGLEALSSLQLYGRGIVGGLCNDVSDHVAAIKMHYAKTDRYAQSGNMIRGDASRRWNGNMRR